MIYEGRYGPPVPAIQRAKRNVELREGCPPPRTGGSGWGHVLIVSRIVPGAFGGFPQIASRASGAHLSRPNVGVMTWPDNTYGPGTRAGWAPTPGEARPGFAVDRSQLMRAADAVAQAISRLQVAQQAEWKSVAADAMREELYAAILVLRSIAAAIDEALDDIGALNFSGMYRMQ